MQELLTAGANFEARGFNKERPLHEAAKNDAASAAKMLINAGANVEADNTDRWRPLHEAALHDSAAVVKVLIKAGADVEATTFYGSRPLHTATSRNSLSAAKALIEAGADVEAAITSCGRRPLHEAALSDAPNVANVLIDAGAALEAPDREGETPLHWTTFKDAPSAAKVLVNAGANVDAPCGVQTRPLNLAALHNAVGVAKVLIEAGTDLEGAAFLDERPLFTAASHGSLAVAKLLIEADANVNSINFLKKTPLHGASERGHTKIVSLLLEAGADPQLCDRDGMTPLQSARHEGHSEVVEVLEAAACNTFSSHSMQQSQRRRDGNVSNGAPCHDLLPSSQQSIEKKVLTILPHAQNSTMEQPQFPLQSLAPDIESPRTEVEVQQSRIREEQKNSTTSDSDSSWTSEEVSDETRAVHDLKEGDIFAENYFVESKPIFGKPLVRLAKGMQFNKDVILKFYDQPNLYAKALSCYGSLNKSDYVCKPLEKIKAHKGFPNCFAFEKGIHTLDEWLRIPDVDPMSKKEALKLVAAALCDLHSRGIVHCDVKPANLAFFPTEHKWKLLDIDSALEVGVAGEMITTISYASPEVLEAVEKRLRELAMQTSADMWAYGIIAFEVFTGKRFYEFEPTVESVLEFVRSERFKQRLDMVEDKRHKHFVKKFLRRDPAARYSARAACTSSIFESATVTVSKPLVSNVARKT